MTRNFYVSRRGAATGNPPRLGSPAPDTQRIHNFPLRIANTPHATKASVPSVIQSSGVIPFPAGSIRQLESPHPAQPFIDIGALFIWIGLPIILWVGLGLAAFGIARLFGL